MAVIIPTLLERANKEGDTTYQETSVRLLELAASDQASFRSVVGSMAGDQKGFMESVILAGRKAAAESKGKDDGADEQEKEPTIALRMDFGG